MKMLETIRIDWEKRFKNLYVSTSAIKNFLRLDWTKKSQERKERYNKEVKYVIDLATALTEDYNRMTSDLNFLNYMYEQMHKVLSDRISEALNDKESVESRLNVFSEGIKTIDNTISKAYKEFNRIGINIQNCRYSLVHSDREMQYGKLISGYEKDIKLFRKNVQENDREINILNNKLIEKRAKLNSLHLEMYSINNSDNTKKVRISLEINSLNMEIGELETSKQKCTNEKHKYEGKLRSLYDNIIDVSNELLENGLNSMKKKVDQVKLNIDQKRNEYKSFETEIETKSNQGNILSKANLIKFNNQVTKYFNEIKALEKLIEIRDNKKSYGAGFFKFISTKETKLEKLKKKFYKIKSDLLKDYKQIEECVNKIEKYQKGPVDEKSKKDILGMLNNIENPIEMFNLEINTHVFGFDEELRTIKIHAIMPFKSQNDGLIESVCEVEILFK